jgi:hypothetical protein
MASRSSLSALSSIAAACAAIVLTMTPAARADDTAAADALFQEGKALADANDFARACPKFEASLAASRSLGTLMNLANCFEQIGKIGSAHRSWAESVELATAQKDDRVAFATERRDALAPRAPKLVLEVTRGTETLTVRVADEVVRPEGFGLPVLVDPGKVTVEVLRGTAVLTSKEVDVSEGKVVTVPLDLDAIARAHPSAQQTVEPADPAQRIAGIVTLSVGIAGVSAFAILEGIAFGQRAQADEEGGCVDKGDTTICSPEGYDLVQRAGDYAEVGQWMGVAGAAVFAVGLTLILTAPSDDVKEDAATVGMSVLPWFAPDGGGIVVRGSL